MLVEIFANFEHPKFAFFYTLADRVEFGDFWICLVDFPEDSRHLNVIVVFELGFEHKTIVVGGNANFADLLEISCDANLCVLIEC